MGKPGLLNPGWVGVRQANLPCAAEALGGGPHPSTAALNPLSSGKWWFSWAPVIHRAVFESSVVLGFIQLQHWGGLGRLRRMGLGVFGAACHPKNPWAAFSTWPSGLNPDVLLHKPTKAGATVSSSLSCYLSKGSRTRGLPQGWCQGWEALGQCGSPVQLSLGAVVGGWCSCPISSRVTCNHSVEWSIMWCSRGYQSGLEGNGAFFDGVECNRTWWNGVECCGMEWNRFQGVSRHW